jgi:hypothetical protein
MKRIKTSYPGVVYREVNRIGGSGLERVYYIIFKKDGKVFAQKVRRQPFSAPRASVISCSNTSWSTSRNSSFKPGSGLWADQACLVRGYKRGENEIPSRSSTAISSRKELVSALTAILSNTNFMVKANKVVND